MIVKDGSKVGRELERAASVPAFVSSIAMNERQSRTVRTISRRIWPSEGHPSPPILIRFSLNLWSHWQKEAPLHEEV